MSFKSEFQHLRIPLQDIISATDNFEENNVIGQGGFGKIYKGEILLSGVNTIVAIKRLDTKFGQGAPEFWKEIMFLSRYKHENLVSLLGFCDESPESLLVYEYLPKKSLDRYLSSTELSWNQRLRICIGTAYGLQYLHDPNEGHQRVLHRDIKSSNVLLDQNWKPKISDFGLSRIGPANQQFTFLFSNAVGTMGYFDPLYYETGFLSKESDVYSFGVVLFEVLCGRLCVDINYDDIRRFLARLAQKRYEEKKLDTIINSSIKEQISPPCLQIFSEVAYQCLRRDRKERPSMADIVNKLETALQCQEEYEFLEKRKMVSCVVLDSESDEYWETKLPANVEALIKKFKIPHAATKRELFNFLHKGYFFDENNQFFWIDDHGNKCLAISAKRILDYNRIRYTSWVADHDSRFTTGAAEYHNDKGYYDCKIKANMLSIGTMYAASLIFNFHIDPNPGKVKLMRIKWKTEELSVHSVHSAHQSQDGKCYTIQMWHFKSHGLNTNFNIIIEEFLKYKDGDKSRLLIQGIEFQPIEMMQEGEEVEGLESLSTTEEEDIDDDEYWEIKLPDEYQRYMAMSDKVYDYTTKKELYLSLCQGFSACNGKLWFSMCKSTRGICSILPATHVLSKGPGYKKLETLSLSESRFKEVVRLGTDNWYNFTYRLGSFMFSPHYSYACYLVFKFEDNHILCSDDFLLLKAEYNLGDTTQGTVFVRLNPTPNNIPTIEPKKDIGLRDSSKSIRMTKGYMDPGYIWVRERNDGWTEFSLIEPLPQLENHESLEVKLFGSLEGIIVEGIEFRPVVRDGSYLAETSTKDSLIGTHMQAINEMQVDQEVEGLKCLLITDEEDIDDDEYWEKKLPHEYPHYIVMSDKPYYYTTKKELYLSLCHGFSGFNGKLWFSMRKSTRGICSILAATHVLSKGPSYKKLETLSLSESRFKEVLRLGTDISYNFTCGLGSFMFSPHYSYACYLVFKFEDNHVLSDDILVLKAEYNLGDSTQGTVIVYLNPKPNNIPTTEPKKDIELRDSSKSIQLLKGCSWVRERNDGWTEFRLIEPLPQLENHKSLEVKLLRPKFGSLEGIILEGIEFRPVVRDGSYLAETSTKDNLTGTHLQAINDCALKMQEDEEVEGLKILSIIDEEDIDDDECWEKKLPDEYPRYILMSDKPYYHTTKKELYLSFCQGFSGCNGKLWFSMCKSTRGICSTHAATHVLSKGRSYEKLETSLSESRFKEVLRLGTDNWYKFKCRLGSFMFSPHYSYACYLVFKFEDNHVLSDDILVIKVEYNLGDTTQGTVFVRLNPTPNNIPTIEPKKDIGLRDSSKSVRMPKGCSWARERNDGWTEFSLIEPLQQLENHELLELKILSPIFGRLEGMIVEGIEFRPVVRDGSYLAETSTKDNLTGTHLQAINDDEENKDDDEYWEKKLPDDYQRHIEMSDEPLDYSTKKELYRLFCHGFLASNDNGQLWFSTCKLTRGLCTILPASHVLSKDTNYKALETLSLSESRFKEVIKLRFYYSYVFTCRLESFMFSPDHDTYACYLVFKFEDNHVLSNDVPIFKADLDVCRIEVFANLVLTSAITIRTLKPEEKIGSSKSIDAGLGMFQVYTNIRQRKSWVEKRNDGWMEARLTNPQLKQHLENRKELKIELRNGGSLNGIIVEGVEFRPVVVDGSYLVSETSFKDNLTGIHLQAINNHEENKDDDEYWEKQLPDDYKRHIEISDEPLDYTTKKELYLLFSHGFLANNDNGQLWFSTCKLARGLCSILPAKHVLSKDTNYKALEILSLSESRFKEVIKLRFYYSYVLTCRLESFMLSPDHYTYACYLVFKFEDDHVLSNDVPIFKADLNDCRIEVFANLDLTSARTIRTLKLEEDIGSSESIDGGLGMFKVYTDTTERKSWVEKRNDGWMEARLINPLLKRPFENCEELKIELRNGGSLNGIIVEGVEFRPEVVDGSYLVVETSIKDNLIGTHLPAINDHEENKDDDEYWEKKLPDDYERHIEMSDEPLDYSTKKELYLLFCHGFLAHNDNGQLWFSTCKLTRGLCSILPATHVLPKDPSFNKLETLSESRFKEVLELGTCVCFELTCRLESFMFSRDHDTYACYLVFKFQDDHVLSNDGHIFIANLDDCYIYVFADLDSKSVITTRTLNEETSWVEKRNDGWMEARLTKPLLKHHMENRKELEVELYDFKGWHFNGAIVEGIEFRPVVVVDQV